MKKTYIIAEAGVNHNGNFSKAKELVIEAAKAGADAVKFQTFDPNLLASKSLRKAEYQIQNTKNNDSQLEMLKKLVAPRRWHGELQRCAKKQGIDFLSTAFDHKSLKFLKTLNLAYYKVGSGDLTNGPLLWQFGQLRKPLIVSTGMATISEVEEALAILHHSYNSIREPSSMNEVWDYWSLKKSKKKLYDLVSLLHCTSQYPAPFDEINLSCIDTMKSTFGVEVGYSDHTTGISASVAAVAKGASIIEKHFTLDKTLEGPDHKASLDCSELKYMIQQIRLIEKGLGDGKKVPQKSEISNKNLISKQVVASKPIIKGNIIKRSDLTTKRLGEGQSANTLWEIVGKKSPKNFKKDEAVFLN